MLYIARNQTPGKDGGRTKIIINCINDLLKLQGCKIRQFIAMNCALSEDSSTVSQAQKLWKSRLSRHKRMHAYSILDPTEFHTTLRTTDLIHVEYSLFFT